MVAADNFEERMECRLLDSVRRRNTAHVIDHEGERELADHLFFDPLDIDRVHVQHHMPAEWAYALEDAPEHVHVRRATQVLDEIEAHAPHARIVQFLKIAVGETVVGVAYAAKPFRRPAKRVDEARLSVPCALACTITARSMPRKSCNAASVSFGASAGV